MTVATRVDETLRDLAMLRLAEFRPELGRALVGEAIDALLGRVGLGQAVKPTAGRASGRLIEAISHHVCRSPRPGSAA